MPKPTPAAQRAYDVVRAEILDGVVAGGALLSEVEVAERLGMSRTPVHEAFLRLAAEDLLELLPRRGAVVVPVTPAEAVEILEVRHALELAAVRRLAEIPDQRAGFTEAVADLLHEQQTHAAAGDLAAFARADAAFHAAIVEASGNRVAHRFYGSLLDRQRRMTVGAVTGRPEHAAVLVEEHRRLAALVADGDAAAFDGELWRHLVDTHHHRSGLRR